VSGSARRLSASSSSTQEISGEGCSTSEPPVSPTAGLGVAPHTDPSASAEVDASTGSGVAGSGYDAPVEPVGFDTAVSPVTPGCYELALHPV
jgi:hypothetical protein